MLLSYNPEDTKLPCEKIGSFRINIPSKYC